MASVVLEEQSLGFSTEIVQEIECCLMFVEHKAEARQKPVSTVKRVVRSTSRTQRLSFEAAD